MTRNADVSAFLGSLAVSAVVPVYPGGWDRAFQTALGFTTQGTPRGYFPV